jgi:4'-phosphopantetheinyl transferase
MTLIYHTFFGAPLPEVVFRDKLSLLPVAERNRVMKFRRWQDAHTSLFGKLQLLEGLAHLGLPASLEELKCNAYGKPYFETVPVSFSISHSGSAVVCALSTDTASIGIDIEEIKAIDISDFKDLWSENEWKAINGGGLGVFYQYWTRKEAIIKAEGMGLSIPLKEIEVAGDRGVFDNKTYFLEPLDIQPGFVVHTASLDRLSSIELMAAAPEML